MSQIDLGVSVSTGTDFWGFPTRKGKVCYINFELPEDFFWRRVNAICKAKDVTLDRGMFKAWHLRGYANSIENLTREIISRLRSENFVLDIIDPVYKALGRRDENRAGDVASMLNELEKIAVETDAAVLFGAHFSKGNQAMKESMDRIGGSGVFARDPDSILTMTTHEEPDCYAVEATLRNFAPIRPFVVRWNWPLFIRENDADPKQLKGANSGQFKREYSPDLVLNELNFQSGTKPKDVIKKLMEVHGMVRRTIYNIKDKLEAQGFVKVINDEWWRNTPKE